MAYREISVLQTREILRRWMAGESARSIHRNTGIDRRAVQRYIDAAELEGLARKSHASALTDELIGAVKARVKPGNPRPPKGAARGLCEQHRAFIAELVEDGVRATKIRILLARKKQAEVPYRTLARFIRDELRPAPSPTVRLDDPPPGREVQVDFGKMGRVEWDGRRRVLWALVFTAVVSRHMFVWLTFRQTTAAFIAGCEAAWRFFGGVFPVMVSDNASSLVSVAGTYLAQLTEGFLAYSQARDFVFDPTRPADPTGKARVERSVPFVRQSFWAGESFVDLEAAQRAAEAWCRTAGERIHGTTRRRPAEVFVSEEQALLLPLPAEPYDPPRFSEPKVRRDGHVTVAKALYSVPEGHIGEVIKARATQELVVLTTRQGQPLRTHPRQPAGERSTHPDDIPLAKRAYATRNVEVFRKQAAAVGPHAEAYVERLLGNPMPMNRMRHLYRFGGLIRRYGAAVDEVCRRALEFDVVDVFRVERMLNEAVDTQPPPDDSPPTAVVLRPRFARPIDHFARRRGDEDE